MPTLATVLGYIIGAFIIAVIVGMLIRAGAGRDNGEGER